MRTTDEEYMSLHLLWRSEIDSTEPIEIDEDVFEEIYKMQKEQECIS